MDPLSHANSMISVYDSNTKTTKTCRHRRVLEAAQVPIMESSPWDRMSSLVHEGLLLWDPKVCACTRNSSKNRLPLWSNTRRKHENTISFGHVLRTQ